MAFFSVIIPLFNKENFIKQTLKSVLKQDFQDFEIIIINDGSTDNSLNLINEFKDPRIQIISQSNSGLAAARNHGIKLAKGKFLALLDADDEWDMNYLKTIHDAIINYPKYNVFSTTYIEKRKQKLIPISANLKDFKKGAINIISDFFKYNNQQFILDQSSLVLRRETFIYKPYNETVTFNEDVDFYLNYFESQKVVFVNNPLMVKNCNDQKQLSQSSLLDKNLPNLNKFEIQYSAIPSIQRFINIQRYKYIIRAIETADLKTYYHFKSDIKTTHLSFKQRVMINLPRRLIIAIRSLKLFLLKLGYRVTSS